jgi:Ni,Fe-hydrogenase III small subunit
MLRILKKILRLGVITEKLEADHEPALQDVGEQIRQAIGKQFGGSLAIRHVDAGSCNACELEVHGMENPFYDVERFGIYFVASPRHADVLLVSGVVSRHMEAAVRRVYDATPSPKLVIAMGDCAANGGEFGISYASSGPVSQVLPVDAVIPGCPPDPLTLMRGILEAIQANPESL